MRTSLRVALAATLAILLGACERPPDKPPVPKVSNVSKVSNVYIAALSAIGFPAARLVPGTEPGAAEKTRAARPCPS